MVDCVWLRCVGGSVAVGGGEDLFAPEVGEPGFCFDEAKVGVRAKIFAFFEMLHVKSVKWGAAGLQG